MKASLEFYELKILKGPERLLRLHVMVKQTLDLRANIEMLAVLIESLLFKNHRLNIEFPTEQLLDAIPQNMNGKYGTILNGSLGIEIVLLFRGESTFKMRYYTEELEFEREIMNINQSITFHQIDMSKYEFQYTIGDMREGNVVPLLSTKINYSHI